MRNSLYPIHVVMLLIIDNSKNIVDEEESKEGPEVERKVGRCMLDCKKGACHRSFNFEMELTLCFTLSTTSFIKNKLEMLIKSITFLS